MSSAQTTKRCHWVPQVYLRSFAADDGRQKIWRFSKDAGDPELKNIDKVAVRFHLYVPRNTDGRRDDSFEKKLADLEQWFETPVWRALRDDAVDLSWDPLRKMVSLLAATMFLRNPKHFALTKELHAQFVQLFSGPNGPPSSIEINGRAIDLDRDTWPAYRDASEDDLKRLWISEINGAGHYAKLLMRMRWSMISVDKPVFITTDNPVVFVHPTLEFRGINDPDTSVMFPISPRRLLCMDHLHHEPANQYYPLKGSPAPHNMLLWRNSIEHLFSHRNPDEVCAEFDDHAQQLGY
ncbi:UNVERIFIED_ORG: hypothetical protein J2W38_003011 [Variovorax paradoxus]|nr:hypothetical protein [Variovorax paradoxus]